MPAKKITDAWGNFLGKTVTAVKYNSSGEISAALANGEVQYALTWTMHGLKSVRDSNLNCFAHTGPADLLALDGVSKIPSYTDTSLKDMPFMGMSVYGWYEGVGMSNKEAKALKKMMKKAIDSPEWNEHSFNARYFQVKHRKAYSWAKKNKDIWIELQN
jgi:tripartite-type tricarboxylate transporter receptor subunit TctC